jgi:DNA processing protein
MDSERELHWLVLSRLPGASAGIRRKLHSISQDPTAILRAPDAQWREAGAGEELRRARQDWLRRGRRHPAHQHALRDQDILRREGAWVLPLGADTYPPLLAEIHDPPPLLYAAGRAEVLLQTQFAIVGSRRHSGAGRRSAAEFAAALVQAGFSICSGMALGIDAGAHRAALESGGSTVAVMGTGIDRVYPRQHRELAGDIRERGVLLTEFKPGSGPRREHFPLRNRVISGLSVGVLVVEAGLRSGSLITARLALEQNREVFALPHSIYDPGGPGCHALIRQGATLVEGAGDILEQVGALCAAHRELSVAGAPATVLPDGLALVYERVGYEPVSLDELVAGGCPDAGTTMAALVELQLRGLVENRSGLYMRR